MSYSGGGAERELIYLANEFSRRGYAVDLLVHRDVGPLRSLVSKNVNSIIIDKTYLADISVLIRYMRQAKPLFILSTLHMPNWVLAIAKMLSFTKTTIFWRVVISLSNSKKNNKGFISTLLPICYPLLSRNVGKITCVSKGVADDMITNFSIKPESLNVMYNPAYTEQIHKLGIEVVEHPWFGKGYKTIVSLGRLSIQKDYKTLIHAFKFVYDVNINARLFILGEGPLREDLLSLISSLGLSEVVSLHGFELNPYKYLAKADLFVLSSIFEGFGNVLVEALALNIPVVSTDCPSGPAEILENGKWGKLVPPSDIKRLSFAILNTLESHQSKDTLVRATEFSVQAVVDKYIELVNEES
ncbi:glycosyltransferase [Vibrio neonatus]|uniref:glycosyltransferase n=1 Tax=Vibrio neonatus TaxID=278860 RepID=UPI0021C37983|nr:glycosyltransferase [Vibrio neonatus]